MRVFLVLLSSAVLLSDTSLSTVESPSAPETRSKTLTGSFRLKPLYAESTGSFAPAFRIYIQVDTPSSQYLLFVDSEGASKSFSAPVIEGNEEEVRFLKDPAGPIYALLFRSWELAEITELDPQLTVVDRVKVPCESIDFCEVHNWEAVFDGTLVAYRYPSRLLLWNPKTHTHWRVSLPISMLPEEGSEPLRRAPIIRVAPLPSDHQSSQKRWALLYFNLWKGWYLFELLPPDRLSLLHCLTWPVDEADVQSLRFFGGCCDYPGVPVSDEQRAEARRLASLCHQGFLGQEMWVADRAQQNLMGHELLLYSSASSDGSAILISLPEPRFSYYRFADEDYNSVLHGDVIPLDAPPTHENLSSSGESLGVVLVSVRDEWPAKKVTAYFYPRLPMAPQDMSLGFDFGPYLFFENDVACSEFLSFKLVLSGDKSLSVSDFARGLCKQIS